MLSTRIKDLKYRKLFRQAENSKLITKFLLINLLNKSFNRRLFRQSILLKALLRPSALKYKAKTRLVRRCLITNRSRGTLQAFGLSRSILRECLSFGIVPGHGKAVW